MVWLDAVLCCHGHCLHTNPEPFLQSLVGSNDQSWGWDLGRNKLYHNAKQGNSGITYPSLLNNDETFVVPDKFFGEFRMCGFTTFI